MTKCEAPPPHDGSGIDVDGISFAYTLVPLREMGKKWAGYVPEERRQHGSIMLCGKHYRQAKREDGVTLGYRTRRGKTKAHVEIEHF